MRSLKVGQSSKHLRLTYFLTLLYLSSILFHFLNFENKVFGPEKLHEIANGISEMNIRNFLLRRKVPDFVLQEKSLVFSKSSK